MKGNAGLYDYLDRPVRDLSELDLFTLCAVRGWVGAARAGRCACRALLLGFERRAVADALPPFGQIMATLDRFGATTLSAAPAGAPVVTDDEARLLTLFRLARGSGRHELERAAAALVRQEAVAPLVGAADAVGAAMTRDAA